MKPVKYEIITASERLAEICNKLRHEQKLALDLEADSMHHYKEKVCLVQLSSAKETWIIDPLHLTDITPLKNLLCDPGKTVVLHGGDYDIRSLYRDFTITIPQMFDTMIGAQFLGEPEFGLAALLLARYGVALDKRFQKADWSRRPLPDEMMNYAAADTAYLIGLAEAIIKELEKKGRLWWVEEECSIVAGNRMAEKGDGPLWLKCKGAGKLQRRNLAILEELLQFREAQARELDRPTFKIIQTDTLVAIAEKTPQSVHDLNDIVGVTERLAKRYGHQIVTAIKKGMAIPENRLPRFPKAKGEPNPGIKARVTELKKWREEYSKKLELAPGLLAPNWLLERIAEVLPKNSEELSKVTGIRKWQIAVWGKDILPIMAKETA